MPRPPRPPLMLPGRNCWRVERAPRAAFIVDGCDYFRALREALLQATHAIYILSWDIHSELDLVHEALPPGDERPTRLREVLNYAAGRHRGLRVYVLNWDFSVFFSTSRQWLPAYSLDRLTHRRVRFHLDDSHPLGSSHHQKVVVVDDALAFVGGLDPTQARWDTCDHLLDDPRRGYGNLPTCRPHHDVQLAVTGPAAAAIGDLARERWRRATGERVKPVPVRLERWPESVQPDLEDAVVGIARTEPQYRDRPEVRENEHLYLDAIAAARRSIYLENQYFTSPLVAAALAERLEDPNGPEVVLVLPNNTDGWLSQVTMDLLRIKLLDELERADRHDRLRVYYPLVPGHDAASLKVHSKLLIVDDWLARVGSTNLNNRSLGLDTECDLAIEARDDARASEAIVAFRNRLLAEHLGVEPAAVASAVAAHRSLIAAIEGLRGGPRSLEALPFEMTPAVESALPHVALLDPERPIEPEVLVDSLVVEDERPRVQRRVLAWLGLFVVAAALWSAWRFTPLAGYLDVDSLLATVRELRTTPGAPLLAYATVSLSGLLLFPITLLILASIVTFGATTGFMIALSGALTSALLAYGIGRGGARVLGRRRAGGRLGRLVRRLRRHGVLSVLLVRIVPVAPFTIVNVAAGASRIAVADYLIGTLLGLLPGILAIALFVDRMRALIAAPSLGAAAALAAVLGAISLAGFFLYRWVRRRAGSLPPLPR